MSFSFSIVQVELGEHHLLMGQSARHLAADSQSTSSAGRHSLLFMTGENSDPHPNARLIRAFHDDQNRFYAGGDQESVRALLTEDVIWHVPGASVIAGEHRGREEVLRHFARRRRLAEATFRIEVRGVLADDERTVILAGGTVERDGETRAWGTVGIFRLAAGRIAECWVVPYDQEAFDEIWSST